VKDSQRLSLTLPAPNPHEQALHDAIENVLGERKATDAKTFGYWARRVKGARIEGFILDTTHNPATNANDITVQRTQQVTAAGKHGNYGKCLAPP
jgi:hypothetical protein